MTKHNAQVDMLGGLCQTTQSTFVEFSLILLDLLYMYSDMVVQGFGWTHSHSHIMSVKTNLIALPLVNVHCMGKYIHPCGVHPLPSDKINPKCWPVGEPTKLMPVSTSAKSDIWQHPYPWN